MTFKLTSKSIPYLIYFAFSLIWIYTFYVSIVSPPFFGYFTVDENYIADSGIFLWYGNTPRCLDWPATPSLLIFFVLFCAKVALEILTHLGDIKGLVEVFERFDLEAYYYLISREEFLITGRAIQLIIVGGILLHLMRFIYRAEHELLTPVSRHVIILAIVSSYVVWFNAPVLRPEALAGSLFFYLIARLVFTYQLSAFQSYVLAALFGIILAERLLFIFVAPIVLGGIFLMVPQGKWKVTWRALGIIIAVFVMLCPFIFTDPLVVMKSFVGGILAKMQDKPMTTFFNYAYIGEYFHQPLHYIVTVLAAAGVWVLVRSRRPFYLLLVANWILFLLMVLRSAKIYDTHVLPAGVLALFAVGLGIAFIAKQIPTGGKYLAVILTLVVAIGNIYEYIQFQNRSHTVSNIERAYHWIQGLPVGSRLLVHPDLEFYLPKTDSQLSDEFEQNRDTTKMVRKLNYLLGRRGNESIQADELPLVTQSFAFEDERLYEVQYQLLRKFNSQDTRKMFNYDVYLENIELANHSVRTQEAIEEFLNGKYEYMITEIRLENIEPVQVFTNNLHEPIYCFKSPKK